MENNAKNNVVVAFETAKARASSAAQSVTTGTKNALQAVGDHLKPKTDGDKLFAIAAPIPYLAVRGITGVVNVADATIRGTARAVFG